MIDPDRLAAQLEATARTLRDQGDLMWSRANDWSTAGKVPQAGVRGGGAPPDTADQRAVDRREARQAGKYLTELRTLVGRIDADSHRLQRIAAITCPSLPKSLATADMLAAQVAADGFCVSCWRHEQHLSPQAEGRYRDRCRWCGDYRRDNRVDPPLDVLRARIEGRPIRVRA